MSKYEDQPAFPQTEVDRDGVLVTHRSGMTLRQYAAIKLKVTDSGVEWLDEMITKSKRDDIAEKAMQSLLSDPSCILAPKGVVKLAYEYSDTMLKAGKV